MDTSNANELRVRELDNLISLAAPHRQRFALLAAIARLHVGGDVIEGTVVSQLNLAQAKAATPALEQALGQPKGTRVYVSGQAAIQHDLDPIFHQDLRRGEFAIALPAALLVLLLVLGLSPI